VELGEKVQELLHHLEPAALIGASEAGLNKSELVFTNYMLFLLFGIALTIVFFMAVRASVNKSRRTDLVPVGVGNVGEMGYEFVRNSIVLDVLGHEGLKYLPLVATVFFAVLIQNFMGLIPGFKPGTGTLGTTLTWGVIIFIWVNAVGFKKKGFGYVKSFLPGGTPLALAPFIWLLEVISHFLRPFTLGVRLYANMYAGHIVLGVFAIFIEMALHDLGPVTAFTGVASLLMQIVMYAFELFVAFIQAYVFAILTAVYIGTAMSADH
jgi:F-type H+-transporting ATPase subunit a